jgi:hypothetical protein
MGSHLGAIDFPQLRWQLATNLTLHALAWTHRCRLGPGMFNPAEQSWHVEVNRDLQDESYKVVTL